MKTANKKSSQLSTLNSQPSTSSKPRRLEEIADSKKGLFAIDPLLLSVEPGFNKRTRWGNLEALATDIELNGLDQPLKIRKVEDTEIIYIVAGHRRHKAITTILIPQGRWKDPQNPAKNRTVDCYSEARFTSKQQRLISQISGNTGLAYTLLEKAYVYQDMMADDPQLKPADIHRIFGETKQAVSDALRLANDGCPELIAAVEDDTLAASTAIQIIKQAKDAAEQITLLTDALATAQKSGSEHITPKHLPPPTSTKSTPSTPSSTSSPSTLNPQLSTSSFHLYQITGVPEEPITPDSPFYHETERLVLLHPPEGIQRLHLLSAVTEHGPAYGYRINDSEHLPDISNLETLNEDPEIGYKKVLSMAATAALLSEQTTTLISNELFDAFCRYYPESGAPEEPETLAFVAIQSPETGAETSGYKAIVNAPSTDRSGSSGPGSGGFVSVDKRLKEIEGLMEKLADRRDTGIPACSSDRITTAEILLQVLRNEMSLSTLKDHLTGKS